ncbi:MAG: 5'-nucleotidase C-terminal domain-containing protein [Chloroflexi bacterium]|nr:5'-nucleotidase C-terminal domain-containing protein [Chloroflexota bacterium]
MKKKTISRVMSTLITLALLLSLFPLSAAAAPAGVIVPVGVSFSILHTNDFHGQLEPSGSNPGMARVSTYVNSVRTALGDSNMLLVDAGDEMQGSLLSNLGDGTATGKGIPTIAAFNAMSYDVATFGNHEFDWGQVNLGNRTTEAAYPYVTANIVQKGAVTDCASAGWTPPTFADAPYQIFTMGTAPDTVKVAFIGVTTTETPTITVSTATAGLCFKDPAESIIHYYDAMVADGAKVIVVLSHLGNADGGYGYGLPVYGDQTLATKLNTAGKPVNLIIGGHSHTNLAAAQTVGTTKVVQAHYNGRRVGRADITVGTDGSVAVTWLSQAIATTDAQDPAIVSVINTYALNPAYLTLVNTPVGYSAVDLGRSNTTDNMMGAFIDDAIYNYLNTDIEPTNDVDLFFNNAGGIRTDWCWNGSTWLTTGCVSGSTHAAGLLTYGNMFTILPFGNATVVGEMTGAQILEVVNYGPNVAGVIQPAGLKYKYFSYKDLNPGPQPYAWGAYEVCVMNKVTHACDPLDLKKTYKVGTNEFLAPGGGDGYNGFKYMKNVTYWGDMLNAVNAYVGANYGTELTAYAGPNGDGTLDGRIAIDGDGDTVFDGGGEIVPLTILHHNDSHGNLVKTPYVAYPQLVTLIKQERLHNPTRTLLLSSGDNIQGDAMSFYFKTAPTGFTSNGTPIADTSLHMQPLIKAFNSMNYDAMTLGNHEFNFGSDVFTSVLSQATFPLLQANIAEDPAHPYGLAAVNVQPYVEKIVGGDINVAILGIGNHRVPNYELPSNIPGLTFSDPIAKAQELSDALRSTNDVVIALTHIGFTEDPKSVEVDANVDTNLAATTTGIDAIIGGHSHTNPATGYGNYKFLPSIVASADGKPVITAHAYRYNNTLGEVVIGLRAKVGGGYEIVSETGRYLTVSLSGTAEDAATKAIIDPYAALLTTYNNTTIGSTTAPIDALSAFTQETNGANLQADAAVYELETKNGIPVDFHLSGAMTNKKVADTATPGAPYSLKISDMFAAMPYENSLVVISMNGPQLKAVLERAYRNYYYYKYFADPWGGYSHYTTCMLDTNFGNQITYNDLYPAPYDPTKEYVVSLEVNGTEIDFEDASTYYNVSTVNYLAAGSCNFNNGGVSLWPLDQIVADTQYYVRDSVIDYVTFMGTVSPAIEGRLAFIADTTAPVITVTTPPAGTTYQHSDLLTLDFSATDDIAGVKSLDAVVDGTGTVYTDGDVLDLLGLGLGDHTLTVTAEDKAGNISTKDVDFSVDATIDALKASVERFYLDGSISSTGIYRSLMNKLNSASSATTSEKKVPHLNAFMQIVKTQKGRTITAGAADLLLNDTAWVKAHLPDTTSPVIKITTPRPNSTFKRYQTLVLSFSASDYVNGVEEITATLDGTPVVNGQVIDLFDLAVGNHTLVVNAVDFSGNAATMSRIFKVDVNARGLKASVEHYFALGEIIGRPLYYQLMDILNKGASVKSLNSFIDKVEYERDLFHISPFAANQMIEDAQFLLDKLTR